MHCPPKKPITTICNQSKRCVPTTHPFPGPHHHWPEKNRTPCRCICRNVGRKQINIRPSSLSIEGVTRWRVDLPADRGRPTCKQLTPQSSRNHRTRSTQQVRPCERQFSTRVEKCECVCGGFVDRTIFAKGISGWCEFYSLVMLWRCSKKIVFFETSFEN